MSPTLLHFRIALAACILFCCLGSAFAQVSYVTIDSILVEGNKRTHTDIVLRDLDFQVGDTIDVSTLMPRLTENEFRLLNTDLFNSAQFNIKRWEDDHITLKLVVKESWYIYPVPIFELADRNFNIWWDEMNRDIKRINLGLAFYHNNLTGRADKLKTVFQFGYTQKFELDYRLPYFNNNKTLGLRGNIYFSRNKEVGYTTQENILEFYRGDDFLLRNFRLRLGISYRPELNSFHDALIQFNRILIDDEVHQLNEQFLTAGDQIQQYLSLRYRFAYDKRNFAPYPTKGFLVNAILEKKGLGLIDETNLFYATFGLKHYTQLHKKLSLENSVRARAELTFSNPGYYHNTALGYFDDYIRAYEYSVIDGQQFLYSKNSLRFQVFNDNIPLRKFTFGILQPEIQTKIFLTFNSDFGIVEDKYFEVNNQLANTWLVGYGVGLDIVVLYNAVASVEYSMNRHGDRGVFLHFKLGVDRFGTSQ